MTTKHTPSLFDASLVFARYGEVLLGQKVRDDAVLLELFDCKITVKDFRDLARAIQGKEQL